MKKMVMIVIAVFFVFGCAEPRFSSEAQYDKGEWRGNASLYEVAKIKRDKDQLAFDNEVGKMALEKLKSQPAYTAKTENETSKGYKGIIANRSKYYEVQIIIRHKNNYEIGSYVLGPGDFQEEYLLQGDYCYEIIAPGHQKKLVGKFTSGPRIFKYFGKSYHWYVYYYD